jgi:glutamate mutase epsilon subunit
MVDTGALALPETIKTFHRERLQSAAAAAGKAYGPDLAIDSVYEMSEEIGALMPGLAGVS